MTDEDWKTQSERARHGRQKPAWADFVFTFLAILAVWLAVFSIGGDPRALKGLGMVLLALAGFNYLFYLPKVPRHAPVDRLARSGVSPSPQRWGDSPCTTD